MTPQDIINAARYTLLDTDATAYRASNAELLIYVNDGIKEISVLRPDLFTDFMDFTCTPYKADQFVSSPNVQYILEVHRIANGALLTPFDFKSFTLFNPTWINNLGTPTQWSKHDTDRLRFYLHPIPPTPICVVIKYVKQPTVLNLTDQIVEVPENLLPALTYYVVYRDQSRDDEHVLSQRAGQFLQLFKEYVKGS